MSRPSVCTQMSTPMTACSNSSWQWDMQPAQPTPYNYGEAGYREMIAMSRSSISAPDLASNEIPPHADMTARSSVSHGQPHDQSFAYFLDGSCSTQDQAESKAAVRMHTGIIPETHSHPMGNLSSDMLGDFQFQPQEAPFYPGFSPGWTFPSG